MSQLLPAKNSPERRIVLLQLWAFIGLPVAAVLGLVVFLLLFQV